MRLSECLPAEAKKKLEKYDASKNRFRKQPESRLVIRLSDAANDPEMSIPVFRLKTLRLSSGACYQARSHTRGNVDDLTAASIFDAFLFISAETGSGEGKEEFLMRHYGFTNACHTSLGLLSCWKLLSWNNLLNATMSPWQLSRYAVFAWTWAVVETTLDWKFF